MRINITILIVAGWVCVGCDYSRHDVYHLSLQKPAITGANQRVADIQIVEDALRAKLSKRGYIELSNSSGDRFWSKERATVGLEHEAGDLRLFVHAFGPKSSFRESGRTGEQLLSVVAAYPNVKVVRLDPKDESTKKE